VRAGDFRVISAYIIPAMALTSLDKDNVNRLMKSLASRELDDSKTLDVVKHDATLMSKLELLYEQHRTIERQVSRLIEESTMNKRLHDAKCNFVKTHDVAYHFYVNASGDDFCSLIGPDEWTSYSEYIGTFYLKPNGDFKTS